MALARPASPAPAPARLIAWLRIVAALVFAMVVVGGITRLTESGLSITEWKPITGAIPPLTEAQWLAEFAKYQQIPEYQQINHGMDLAAFKFIFFWEYIHRLLGRVIGLAFALPLAWFWWKRQIPAGYGPRLVALLFLGGLQGAVGWWMVTSGLVLRTDVSHFRLATHLLVALFIIAGLLWTAFDLKSQAHGAKPARLTGFGLVVALILLVQLLFGAFTAGLDAGYVSSTWPLMNDHVFPEGVTWLGSALATIGNDPFLIHFIHRWWAWVVVIALVMLARKAKQAGERRAAVAIHATVGLQVLLGIATVVTGMNFWLAVLHQAVGALVVASTTWGLHVIGRRAG
ncbi:COX15/CtaA family protein [Sphingomonas colocasiae]|uniref:Heme A synthase n=1 Tax=Sphingomonas colocasiae TaxID=1848973 RepID=A0ABS7PWD6_9SPHN|nr:COX15/CtaA family protein [Sphingomonas colocasiae]MBY8825671.1 COX15/CtaA family protein [Sphingomonas colocasiae]